ncbi:SnoaL-like domain-containing protein [Favolaschia claudopus]|uniref:SnoaL-like domain-containing protein n=1 Tax=Favolaschia claudopus TaxID=2862362 RepID=A0AAW0BF46_9AGAR
MSDLQAKQLDNAHAFLSRLNDYDFDGVAELLAPDFTHEYCPSTLPAPEGKFKRNKEETVEVFKHSWLVVFEKVMFLPPIDTIQGQDAVVFHLKSDGTPKSGGKKYSNEYMLTFRFRGEKIVYMREFVDSKYAMDYFGADGPGS